MRLLGKKKPKIERMHWAFSTFVSLFPSRNGQYFVSAFFFQIVFATPYYTDEAYSCQAFIESCNAFPKPKNSKFSLRKLSQNFGKKSKIFFAISFFLAMLAKKA
ncbi:hypothetical protein [Enterococcus sp.]|uniref:hypothetical protein n=1 Tax=Enterococcus sp. TaxID=35783 RepID=UPI0025BB3153|nr:hypothetical protein [Enterococcus sp.]